MPYRAFAPAADSQFGNAVLSRYPITAATYAVIPTEGIPQRRSYLLVTLDVNGTEVRLINTHLSAWVDAESHIPQVELVLQAWANAPRTLITGDMNSVPGAPDIQLFFDAGLTSAQDEVGDATAFTANARNPDVRIDWIFGTSDLGFSEFAIPQSQASDHFAVAVTITIEEVE
jgi:endonuclease/exonuclease/phosphatase family metal-dependent hydrolase